MLKTKTTKLLMLRTMCFIALIWAFIGVYQLGKYNEQKRQLGTKQILERKLELLETEYALLSKDIDIMLSSYREDKPDSYRILINDKIKLQTELYGDILDLKLKLSE